MPAVQWNSVLTATNNPEVFQCRLCTTNPMGGDEAENHLAAHHGTTIVPITCSVCGWTFKHIGRFASHQSLHLLRTPCRQCGTHFANAAERFNHLTIQHGLTQENVHLFK